MDDLQGPLRFSGAPTVEERERLTENFLQELRSTLQQFPILSRTVSSEGGEDLLYQALCWLLDDLSSSEILKCIIQANPHSLLWKHEGIANARLVASDHPRLVLWIAKHYDWVLRDERSELLAGDDSGDSPLVGMAWEVVQGRIGVTEIKAFYDQFPDALFQMGTIQDLTNFPLQVLLRGLAISPRVWSQEYEGLIQHG